MTLYISDLDGTLLTNDAKVSSLSRKLLNESLDNNINFTIATARTPATVINLLDGINFSLPIITMNGAAIYDINKKEYIHTNYINTKLVKKINDLVNNHNMNAFIYTLKENHLYIYHKDLANSAQNEFYYGRNTNPYKTFINGDLDPNSNVLHFAILDSKENIDELYNEVIKIPNLYVVKYKDTYINCYCLEIYDITSSKANAIKYLKNLYNFNKLITFGDNVNDIPMFEISDECYAVENAVPELKKISTRSIESNTNDAVAKFIHKKIKKMII